MITFAIDLQILIACHQFDISSCTYLIMHKHKKQIKEAGTPDFLLSL